MKTTFALLLLLATRAFALTASFDQLQPGFRNTTFTEDGITFSSPTSFTVVTGTWAATLFGWGGYSYQGNALSVGNDGWVSISTASLIDSVSLTYGFDWNGYTIEDGLMDVNVEWEALAGGTIIATGGLHFDRDHRSHGGGLITTNPEQLFDQLLIRSTAVAYQGIPWVGPNPHGWFFDRGPIIGYGDANHLAFDNVTVNTISVQQQQAPGVPDSGCSLVLLLAAVAMLIACRKSLCA